MEKEVLEENNELADEQVNQDNKVSSKQELPRMSIKESIKDALNKASAREDKKDNELPKKKKEDASKTENKEKSGKSATNSGSTDKDKDKVDDSGTDKSQDKNVSDESKQQDNKTKTKEVEPNKEVKKYKAPVGWTKEAKAEFDNLPEAVKASVMKREDEASKGFKDFGEQVKELKKYDDLVEKYTPDYKNFGVTKTQVIERTLQWYTNLNSSNKDFAVNQLLAIAKSFKLDDKLKELIGSPTDSKQPQVDQSRAVIKDPEIDSIKSELMAFRQQRANDELQRNKEIVDNWSADKEHFETVRDSMRAILASGQIKVGNVLTPEVLDQAYTKAVRQNDELYAQVLEQEREKIQEELEAAQKAARRQQQVSNSKVAASSLRGNAPILPTVPKPGTVKHQSARQSIMAALKEVQGT